ncbi:MAG: hypothetical protein HOP30_08935 [Cyclobacteriaceae bacterium]|nr:hypothetical protein [Cyclobacteriaceae bacterium]
MIDNLSKEQIEVLFDFVAFAKREHKSYHPPTMKVMQYDHIHGDGESVELLNLCFYDLIKIEELNSEEIRELAIIVSQREIQYKVEPDDIFHPENEGLNEINEANRKKNKTNGQEYL